MCLDNDIHDLGISESLSPVVTKQPLDGHETVERLQPEGNLTVDSGFVALCWFDRVDTVHAGAANGAPRAITAVGLETSGCPRNSLFSA